MIFSGPFGPNRIDDTFVASVKVGEGGPGEVLRRELNDRARIDLVGMAGTRELRKGEIACTCLGLHHNTQALILTLEPQSTVYKVLHLRPIV